MIGEEVRMAKVTQWRGDNAPTPLNPPDVYVPKDSPVILALGALQELSASLGLARSLLNADLVELQNMLREAQRHLYIFKCDLASISNEEFVNGKKIPRPNGKEIQIVDQNVGSLEDSLGNKPDRFILEGGAAAATALFLANEVARRAERLFISLQNSTDTQVGLQLKTVGCQQYLNHLSYQLYLMARVTNRTLGVPEESISTDPATGEVIVTTDTQIAKDSV